LRTSVEDTFDLVSIFEKNPAISLGFAGTWAVLGFMMKGTTDLAEKVEANRKEAQDDAKAIMSMARDDAKAIMSMARDDAKAIRREGRENVILIAILVVAVQSLVSRPVVTTQMSALASWLPGL